MKAPIVSAALIALLLAASLSAQRALKTCSYRVLETREPIKGFAAVRDQIRDLEKNVERFEILDTFARGPMVFNERIDHFKPGGSIPLRSWDGVGVFFLKDRTIVEWQDFTISTQRA